MKKYKLSEHSKEEYVNYLDHQGSHKGNVHRSAARYSNEAITGGLETGLKQSFGGELENILAVGCRSQHELNFLQSFAKEVKGVDLFTSDATPQIVAADMHSIADIFVDDEFDIIYSCHSLEHSAKPSMLLNSMKKISREGGLFVAPPTARTDEGPTKGHPLWVWCFHPDRFTVPNIQDFVDDLCGENFAKVVYSQIIDSSNYCFSLKWNKNSE